MFLNGWLVQVPSLRLSILVAVVIAVLAWFFGSSQQEAPVETRFLRVSVEVKNPTNQPIVDAFVSVSAPATVGQKQRLLNVQASDGLAIHELSDDVRIDLGPMTLAPFAARTIRVDMALEMGVRTRARDVDPKYLESSHLIAVKSPVTDSFSSVYQQKGFSPEDFARWLSGKIQYAGYIAEARGSDYALTELVGDCTEYSAAMVAVLRAQKIPSRIVAGIMVSGSKTIVRSSDYHNWVEYHDGERWVAVDPQYGRIAEDSRYVIFHEVNETQGRHAQRFVSTSKALNIRIL